MSVITEKSPQVQTVETLFEAMKKQDWATIKSCLTEDVLYRVGSSEPVYGYESVEKYLSSLYEQVKFEGADVRQVLEPQGQVIFEMDTHYLRLADNHSISFACTDILRMQGNKIREWRVYVDLSPMYA